MLSFAEEIPGSAQFQVFLSDPEPVITLGHYSESGVCVAAIRALDSEWAQRIPIIAMTANAYADDVQQAFDAGMNAHVTKPIDIKVMEKSILQFKQ